MNKEWNGKERDGKENGFKNAIRSLWFKNYYSMLARSLEMSLFLFVSLSLIFVYSTASGAQ
jgi:hypothetical protein